jgi:1,4-dihydroxy-2-naphthoyl-CoA hydrolase
MDQETLDTMVAMTIAEGTLAATMGITIVSASGAEVVATMPVAGNIQPFGLLHGGASCVLAETIGSLGAALHAGPGRIVVGIEINATHHRGARDGQVTGVARLAHGGRTLATYDIVISDADGRRVCTSRLTCLIRDNVPGAAETSLPPTINRELSAHTHASGTRHFAPRGDRSLTW